MMGRRARLLVTIAVVAAIAAAVGALGRLALLLEQETRSAVAAGGVPPDLRATETAPLTATRVTPALTTAATAATTTAVRPAVTGAPLATATATAATTATPSTGTPTPTPAPAAATATPAARVATAAPTPAPAPATAPTPTPTPTPAPAAEATIDEITARLEAVKRYPPVALRRGLEGRVTVRFRIATDGAPEDLSIASSSGAPLLDAEALDTVRRAAPLPLRSGPVVVPIEFVLR